jgi:hypothetical protein
MNPILDYALTHPGKVIAVFSPRLELRHRTIHELLMDARKTGFTHRIANYSNG